MTWAAALVGAIAAGAASGPAAAEITQNGCVFTHTRHVDIFYGTLIDPNGQTVVQAVHSSDHLTGLLAGQFFNTFVPAWVGAGLGPYVDLSLLDIPWVDATPEGLDAAAALDAALAPATHGFAANPIADDTGAVPVGAADYHLADWTTNTDPTPECPTQDHLGHAAVAYFERTIIVGATLAPPPVEVAPNFTG
ncbi:MAG: hypothetical protein WDA60_01980 [Acidimicrobiia bacterium]